MGTVAVCVLILLCHDGEHSTFTSCPTLNVFEDSSAFLRRFEACSKPYAGLVHYMRSARELCEVLTACEGETELLHK